MHGLESLQTAQEVKILNTIDGLRSCGLDGVLSLPQLIVCGDQSSGKNSVLEAIAEIPFPRKENLCTRFATEVILRRARQPSISCRIVPDKDRPAQEQAAINQARLTITSFQELPSLVDKVTTIIGLDDATKIRRAFAKDILSIEVLGPDRPQLTLVDLPGLIHAENKAQTKEDVELISGLVDNYLQNKRTIILPIISAKNDPANQVILSRAKKFDPDGHRTLGIITKPDELAAGSGNEDAFIGLAKNEDIFFALGWHVVKNRGFSSMTQSFCERNRSENLFFSKGRWQELSPDCMGINSLRSRLSDLLFQHVQQELPSLRLELDRMYHDTTNSIDRMGEARATRAEQRSFLIKLSTEFRDIVKAAVDGHYEDKYFSEQTLTTGKDKSTNTRLCAVVHKASTKFADLMRKHGHMYHLGAVRVLFNPASTTTLAFGTRQLQVEQEQKNWTQALTWVKSIMDCSRGRELPGNFNPLLVAELFRIQAGNWDTIASAHVEAVIDICTNFCQDLLGHICPSDIAKGSLANLVRRALDDRADAARKELENLRWDRLGTPTTYNHYYTMTIQKSRKRKHRQSSGEVPSNKRTPTFTTDSAPAPDVNSNPYFGPFSKTSGLFARHASTGTTSTPATTFGDNVGASQTQPKVANSIPTNNVSTVSPIVVADEDEASDSDSGAMNAELDMDAHACGDALDSLLAYYKVARKTFIDNVSIQVIDRHIMRRLAEVFSPLVVATWDDAMVGLAAAESARVVAERQTLEAKRNKLKRGKDVFASVLG